MKQRDIFTERGISPRVWKSRPYVWYDKGDLEAVLDADPNYRNVMSRKQRYGWLQRVVKQSSGYVMARQSPPLWMWRDVPPFHPFAELRPTKRVVASWKPHTHHGVDPPPAEHFLEAHNPITWKELYALDDDTEVTDDDHYVIGDPEDSHAHVTGAKYVFPPSVLRWKAGRRIKDPEQPRARRLDMHRRAAHLLHRAAHGGRIWIALEGVLKADALLSQGEAVVNVPSVTLWNTAELRAFAEEYLLGDVRVYVLTDSDYQAMTDEGELKNDVLRQAMLCREMLRGLGVRNVEVAAPPSFHGEDKVGFDDLLGNEHLFSDRAIRKGRLDDVEIIGREVPEAVYGAARHHRKKPRADEEAKVLAWMSLMANPLFLHRGEAFTPARTIARWTGIGTRSVQRYLVCLREHGLIQQLEPVTRKFNTYTGGWYTVPPLDRIVKDEYVAPITVRRLCDAP